MLLFLAPILIADNQCEGRKFDIFVNALTIGLSKLVP